MSPTVVCAECFIIVRLISDPPFGQSPIVPVAKHPETRLICYASKRNIQFEISVNKDLINVYYTAMYEIVRMFHASEDGKEKSVPRITDCYHKACPA